MVPRSFFSKSVDEVNFSKVATVHPAFSNTVISDGRQMKQCCIKYIKKLKISSLDKISHKDKRLKNESMRRLGQEVFILFTFSHTQLHPESPPSNI
jgi:hypothetical protein